MSLGFSGDLNSAVWSHFISVTIYFRCLGETLQHCFSVKLRKHFVDYEASPDFRLDFPFWVELSFQADSVCVECFRTPLTCSEED